MSWRDYWERNPDDYERFLREWRFAMAAYIGLLVLILFGIALLLVLL